MHAHDDTPCWDAHCAPHHTHHDPGVRELIARAEARGAERVAQAVEKALDEMTHWCGPYGHTGVAVFIDRRDSYIRDAITEATR